MSFCRYIASKCEDFGPEKIIDYVIIGYGNGFFIQIFIVTINNFASIVQNVDSFQLICNIVSDYLGFLINIFNFKRFLPFLPQRFEQT